jgi:Co/Zn/Cd efflux system component
MDTCCIDKACALEQLRERQSATLRIVLILNVGLFAIELVAGLLAGSVALLADSLDNLGDALVYGFSLYVVGLGLVWKVRAAFAKAAVMGLFGAFVLGHLLYKLVYPQVPAYETMGAVGALALIVNAACCAALWRHRGEDINMRSVWLCSRNDIVANVSVLLASLAVWRLNSAWPDIVVGAMICGLFLHSAFAVAVEARNQLRNYHAETVEPSDAPLVS